MSHDAVLTNQNMARSVSKLRVIIGLLCEVDAAEVLVIFSNKKGRDPFTARISCEFKVPFESSVLQIMNPDHIPGEYTATALFAGQRLTFDVEILNENGQCALPKEILISEHRGHRRRKFGPEIQYAEIYTKNGVIMAAPIDMSQNAIALKMSSSEGSLSTGETVRLVIRGDTTGQDIFTAELEVKEFSQTKAHGKILLGPGNPQVDLSGGPMRSTSRHPISQMALVIGPLDDHLGESVNCVVTDISLTGFQCQITDIYRHPWLMPGMSIEISDMNVTGTISWLEGTSAGIRINALGNSKVLHTWAGVLMQHRLGHGFHHAQSDDLVSLLTEAGLLKGSRRKIFGRDASGYLPSEAMQSNPLLYHRILAKVDGGKFSGHISMARLTDDFWCFQEGAHTGEGSKTYRNLYAETISQARHLYESSRLSPRFLTGLYHANIKSVGTLGAELFEDPSSRVYQFNQTSIAKNLKKHAVSKNVTLTPLESLDAEGRRKALSPFDATLAEGFSGVNGTHPRFNAELAKLGPHHEAKTLLVGDNENYWGIAYRLKSYYALNTTGVMNSLFLVVLPSVAADDIVSGIKALVDEGLAFGTDDAAIIACAKPGVHLPFVEGLVEPRPFTFFIIDNHLNREFLGGNSETTDSRTHRKKRG